MTFILLLIVCPLLLLFCARVALRLFYAVGDGMLAEQIIKRGGEVNCHTLAEQYVINYHADKMHPFTEEEEANLIHYLEGRFGVFEETAAEIVAANWPHHRSGLPYRGIGGNAVTRGNA